MRDALRERLAEVVGSVDAVRALTGGDINDAYAIEAGGETLFVKTRANAPEDMYSTEARGLRFLADAGALRVPRVVAVDPAFLVLEYLPPTAPNADYDEVLGRGLASLHRAAPPGFGLDHDNYVGSLPQANTPCATWAEFYWERRLSPLLHSLPAALRHRFDALRDLPDLLGPGEPPSRLHGDLWGGNVHSAGAPVLVDPAVYGGHREIDLAMMRLFGGFSARVFAAYEEAHPLAPGHARRVPLYQLYPLLVHVGLFGARYVPAVSRALDALDV